MSVETGSKGFEICWKISLQEEKFRRCIGRSKEKSVRKWRKDVSDHSRSHLQDLSTIQIQFVL